jgi:hypothetical protein
MFTASKAETIARRILAKLKPRKAAS